MIHKLGYILRQMMSDPKYAQVVFPLPFRNAFTYLIPDEFTESVKVGVRVVVPFGKRVLTGFVVGALQVLFNSTHFDTIRLHFTKRTSFYNAKIKK